MKLRLTDANKKTLHIDVQRLALSYNLATPVTAMLILDGAEFVASLEEEDQDGS